MWLWFFLWFGAPCDHVFTEAVVKAYAQRQPINLVLDTKTDADALQECLIQKTNLGPIIGYKAALTSKPAQTRFGVDRPLMGLLFRDMAHEGVVRRSMGVSLLIEGDLAVRVGNIAINEADTQEAVRASLDAVVPLVELPDWPFAAGLEVNGPMMTAANAGARAFVLGQIVPLTESIDLDNIEMRLIAPDGQTLGSGQASMLLGHPLDAALWLIQRIRERGRTLQVGDWLSLGSLTPPRPLSESGSYRAEYLGLGEKPLIVTIEVE